MQLKTGLPTFFIFLFAVSTTSAQLEGKPKKIFSADPEYLFRNPPPEARPGVLWMWMGSNLSKQGITKDLEALKQAGFNRTTMFSLADITTPWAGEIKNSPTPELISWTEPWWKLVRHAALESKRLGMDFGMFNGPGYEASGGPWIAPELSMQELCWSQTEVEGDGNSVKNLLLPKPQVDPRANMLWPIYNPKTDSVEKPALRVRQTYYRDITVLAAPAGNPVSADRIIIVTAKPGLDGKINWVVPPGHWTLYRIGHTTMGALIQPAQWKATGLECDKMNPVAVQFHIDHIIGEIKKHLGDLIGKGFSHVHFDSYEAGTPSWTPKMREEFRNRRGYDLLPYLLNLVGRNVRGAVDSLRFRADFDATIRDLYRDVYFKTLSEKLRKAGLVFLCEPYGGPWNQAEIMPSIHHVMTEFWTNKGEFTPYELAPTVAALRLAGQNLVEAEAFTGAPADSKWNETPAWLKPIGDAAFCAGVNRLVLHRFVQQPWEDHLRPGATMGQWGTHFDRTQTWWKEIGALVEYWKRCQALLQWGRIASDTTGDFQFNANSDSLRLQAIHRSDGKEEVYFVANLLRNRGSAVCRFRVAGKAPELWDPVTGETRDLPQYVVRDGVTSIDLEFAEAQSFFIVFRKAPVDIRQTAALNFPAKTERMRISQSWQVQFDPAWGGPAQPIIFDSLQDWTKNERSGIRYFSGTAQYTTSFQIPGDSDLISTSRMILDLGIVHHLARVRINQVDLGLVWTAPWQLAIPPGVVKIGENQLQVEVTNVWANRLIGDEQEPDDCEWLPGHQGGRFLKRFPDWFLKKQTRPSSGRYCFTTWNYFTRNSPLVSSGLLGPVRLLLVVAR